METLPPTGWADVATKHDLDQLEARLELRVDARLATFERRIIQWNVATVLTALAAFTALIRLT